MPIREAFRDHGIAMTETEEVDPIEHVREEIGQNQYFNLSGGDQDGVHDNRDYNDEESDNPDYYGDQSEGQVLCKENGGNRSPSELERDAVDGGGYGFRRRGLSGESFAYRANIETMGVRLSATLLKSSRRQIWRGRENGKKERHIQKVEKAIKKRRRKFRNSQRKETTRTNLETAGKTPRKWHPNLGLI